MWQSKAPTPTTTSPVSPRRCDHSGESLPTGRSAVSVVRNSLDVNPFSRGSREEKNSSGGRPPNCSAHSALWPAEHTPRVIAFTSLPPVSKKGIQSQCSTHDAHAERTSLSTLNTCSNFAQNH